MSEADAPISSRFSASANARINYETVRKLAASPPPIRNYDRERVTNRRQRAAIERMRRERLTDRAPINSGFNELKMIVTPWQTDEQGCRTRTIFASEATR